MVFGQFQRRVRGGAITEERHDFAKETAAKIATLAPERQVLAIKLCVAIIHLLAEEQEYLLAKEQERQEKGD